MVVSGLVTVGVGASAQTAAPPAAPAAPAQTAAPAVTAEAAAGVAAAIEGGLRQWFPAGGPAKWDGTTVAGAAGDHYDVTLPVLTVAADDGSRIQIGAARLWVAPDPGNVWRVSIALPPQMTLLGADGKPEGDLTFGTQRFTGRWVAALGTFVQADGSLGDVRMASRKDKSRLEIGTLSLRTDLTEQPPGRWSGPSAISVEKLNATDDHGVHVARLGSGALEATLSGMNLSSLSALGTQTAVSASKAKHAVNAHYLAQLHDLFAGVSSRLRLNDLNLTSPGDGSTFSLAQVSLRAGIEGLDRGRSILSVGYDHGGLKLVPSPGPNEFVPEKIILALSAVDLPNADLWAALEQMVMADGSSSEQAGQMFALQSMAAMAEAGSRLLVESLHVDTPVVGADLKGEARFNTTAATGVVAGFEMMVRGLDSAMKKLQPAPGAKVSDETRNTMGALSMVQALGTSGKDADGRDTRTYKLDLGDDGRIMLNGADMSALLQSGSEPGGQKPASKANKGAAP